ncbi:MAG: MotA/TolQ/ExbB proton channel family protein, partial [Myxococcota bacterium]
GLVFAVSVDAQASAEGSGFLRTQPDAPPIVVGPPLSSEATEAIRDVKPGASGQLPFDIDGALTRVDAEPPRDAEGLWAGGFFVWPILAVGLLGIVLVSERFWYFFARPVHPERIDRVTASLQHGDVSGARTHLKGRATDLDRVLGTGIDTFQAPRVAREQALETALLKEEPALERGVSLLGAVAGLAPLLGLLGTVTGMISTFDVISTFGTGNPRLLSQGISIALITTQLGLIVAVPAMLAHAWVTRAVARRQALLEEARTSLLSIHEADEP